MQNQEIVIDGPTGDIAIIHEMPANYAHFLSVISSPHPQHDGTMQNKVVYTAARAILRLNGIAVRYNYRGVGNSDGVFDNGDGETDDLHTVIHWAQAQAPHLPLILIGFSFGSMITLKASKQHDTKALLLIAPPIGSSDYQLDKNTPLPNTIVIQGGEDDIVQPDAVIHWARQQHAHLTLIADTGHFFHGRLSLLRHMIICMLQESIAHTDNPTTKLQ